MAVSFVASSTSGASSGALTINEPAGCADGDLLVLFVGFYTDITDTVPTPSGWTALTKRTASASPAFTVGQVFYRIRSGAANGVSIEPPAAGDKQLAVMHAFRGVDQTTPVQTSAFCTPTAFTLTPTYTPSSLTVNRAGSFLSAGNVDWGTAAPSMSATGAAFTARSTAGAAPDLTTYTAPIASAGSVSSIGAEYSAPGVGHILVIQPPNDAVTAPVATATGAAPALSAQSVQPVTLGVATASGVAPALSASSVQPVTLPVASASAQAPALSATANVTLPVAAAAAQAPALTAQAVQPVTLPLAQATGQALSITASVLVLLPVAAVLVSALALRAGNLTLARAAAGLWNSRRGRGRR